MVNDTQHDLTLLFLGKTEMTNSFLLFFNHSCCLAYFGE